LFISAIIISACAKVEAPAEVEDCPVHEVIMDDPAVVPGCAEIKFSPEMTELVEEYLKQGAAETKSAGLNELFSAYGITSLERIFPYAGEYEERTRREGLHQYYRVEFDPSVSVTKAQDSFEALDGVLEFDPIRRVKTDAVFNDPKFSNQWDLYNHGYPASKYSEGCDINVVDVWKYYTTGDPSVIVSVVDGGIDYSHEDLAYNYVGGYNFVRNSSKVVAHDHGSHVAGTIAATSNNGVGICGIAGGNYAKGKKGVGLLSCQIFQYNETTKEDDSASGATAIKYGADHGAVISQNSWGYVFDSEADAKNSSIGSSLKSAIDYFIKYAGCDNSGNQKSDSPMKGGIVIFAAGNEAYAYDPIGQYDPVLSVGAIGADFNRSYYSNYGDWVDICAPGGDAQKGPTVLSTTPNNTYSGFQGTSMACPHVSGVAALVVSYHGGQGFTPDMLRSKLINGANKTAVKAAQKIGPLVDALGAITYGDKIAPDKVTSYTAESTANNIVFNWNVTSDSKGRTAYAYKVFAAKDQSLLTNLNPATTLPSGVVAVTALVEERAAGDAISATISDLDFEAQYYVAVAGYSYSLSYSALSPIKTVTTKKNNAPVVDWSKDYDFTVKSHETKNYPLDIHEPDNHRMTVNFTAGSDAAELTKTDLGYVLTIKGTAVDAGTYSFVIKATDSYGAITEKTQKYTILENHAPEKKKDVENILLADMGVKFNLDMDEYIVDPDGEDLVFSATTSDKSILYINPTGSKLVGTGLDYGIVDVTITGTDAKGLTCKTSFQVLVKNPSVPVELSSTTVTDELSIRTGEPTETFISLTNQTGKVIYQNTSIVGAFEPAVINMKAYAPGIYKLIVKMDGKTYTYSIIKK